MQLHTCVYAFCYGIVVAYASHKLKLGFILCKDASRWWLLLQDPVLFSGTLRSNLDPWDQHDDAALWRVLSAVQLKAAIRTAGGLHVKMAEAGENLSVGQRQLFCLARCARVQTSGFG